MHGSMCSYCASYHEMYCHITIVFRLDEQQMFWVSCHSDTTFAFVSAKKIYCSVFNITKSRTIHPHPKYTHRVTPSLIHHMHNSHLYTSTCRNCYETWHRPVNIHTSRPCFTQALKLLSDGAKFRIRELLDHMVVKSDRKLYRLHNTLSFLSTGRTSD